LKLEIRVALLEKGKHYVKPTKNPTKIGIALHKGIKTLLPCIKTV
jgi:hypothetical protein